MGKFRALIRLATTAGPIIYGVVRKYGPQLKELVEENPQLFAKIEHRVAGFANKKGKRGRIEHRIEVLRDQTTYLYASANNAQVAKQVAAWRDELESLRLSVNLLNSMSSKRRRASERLIETRIDELSGKILETTIQDDIEDAEVVDDE